jgi:alkylation response protein AidB-like acyl-CoA dehydrogenase
MARSLSYYAAWALEAGAPDAASAVAAAKSFAGEAFIQLASDNIQNHGGMGFTWEVDAHFYLKRSKAWETYLGSPRVQREKLAVSLGW